IRWISGHDEVEGNERADEEAKKAAKGEGRQVGMLEKVEKRGIGLLISVSAVKMEYKKSLKERWEEQWNESKRGKRMEEV
ncbi:hypothetical protein FA15DRAFT_552804, partial [Coprinopsis marcescibilis]